MALPSLVCLKSYYNNQYLRYRYENVQAHNALQFAAETVMDPYAQFEVEKAKTWDDLVHIKSRYNNKYLVRWSPNHEWITASAYAPNEDQGSWACTLFKPIIVEKGKIRLLHVQLGQYVTIWDHSDDPFESCLRALDKSEDDSDYTDVFIVVDWESVFKLPKRVAFKGDNELYLGATHKANGQPGLQFSYKDLSDPKVAHEIFPSPDGTIYIKSEHYGKFWRYGNEEWILADGDDPRGTNDASAMFRLSVVDFNVLALMNMSCTMYCKRFTTRGSESFLRANTQSIDECATLEVVDLENPESTRKLRFPSFKAPGEMGYSE